MIIIDTNKCKQCGEESLYKTEGVFARGGYGPDLLPGLASIWSIRNGAKFQVVACSNCGLTQFYADEKTRTKLATSEKWKNGISKDELYTVLLAMEIFGCGYNESFLKTYKPWLDMIEELNIHQFYTLE